MALSSLLKPSGVTTNVQAQQRVVQQVEQTQVKAQVKKAAPKVAARKATTNVTQTLFVNELNRPLKRAELWFGEPGSGKTTLAINTCDVLMQQGLIEDYTKIICHEDLNLMSLLKTTRTDEQGNWKFLPNKVFNMLTDEMQKRYIIILDEFNTLPMSVMKAMQPILDDTVGKFDFEDKVYDKNPNLFFILTMNHRDLGISELPIAIKDRLYPRLFQELSVKELSKRSGVPIHLIELLTKTRQMFEHLGDLPEFHKSVRQLKELYGADGDEVAFYMKSQLALAQIEYEEAIAMSPEFRNLCEEFERQDWSGK